MPATLRFTDSGVNALGGEGGCGAPEIGQVAGWELGGSGSPFGFCCLWLRDGG